jgi:hypothetical protein
VKKFLVSYKKNQNLSYFEIIHKRNEKVRKKEAGVGRPFSGGEISCDIIGTSKLESGDHHLSSFPLLHFLSLFFYGLLLCFFFFFLPSFLPSFLPLQSQEDAEGGRVCGRQNFSKDQWIKIIAVPKLFLFGQSEPCKLFSKSHCPMR